MKCPRFKMCTSTLHQTCLDVVCVLIIMDRVTQKGTYRPETREYYPEFKYFRQFRQLSAISAEYQKDRDCRMPK